MATSKPQIPAPIHKEVGEPFFIERTENPSTGYRLVISQLPEGLALLSDDYQPASQAPGLVGVPGKRTFVFAGIRPTEGTIVLQFSQPGVPVTLQPPTFGNRIPVQIFDPKQL